MKHIKEHSGYYVVLLTILGLELYLVFLMNFDRRMQMLLVVMTAFLYIGWGILHHYLHHDISVKVVLEYLLIGALAISIIFLLL